MYSTYIYMSSVYVRYAAHTCMTCIHAVYIQINPTRPHNIYMLAYVAEEHMNQSMAATADRGWWNVWCPARQYGAGICIYRSIDVHILD